MATKKIAMAQKTTNFKKNRKVYIVGVGASAGGLEAIHDLFDYMPDNSGFSFVVIQHLSPDYKSLMADLLSKHTHMRVQEAQHGMKVEPNCIYVIPSKMLMTIKDGHLELVEKQKTKLPNNAIDVFFESLAKDCKNQSIGIILSGTGTDGTKGIESIKNEGGIVIVQDPLSASFDGMPNSAVASGFADLILPPEMMGEELMDYIEEGPFISSLNRPTHNDEVILREIIEMLNHSTKLDFSNYKRPTLFRRLAKRISELGISSILEYKNYLIIHEEEVKVLGKEFLINVTKFFRDIEAFESLRTEAIPTILASKKPDEPIKVWVVACSSGEEAYSVGILFLEQLEKDQRDHTTLKIFATDIDTDALETASRGLYTDAIEKDITPERLKKYFVREGNMYRVSVDLRKHVVFANHDILKDPPFSHIRLITCRNMFIYVNSALQQKMLKKFHFALSIDSFLMLGPSENIDILKDSMDEVNRKWKLYRCTNKINISETDNVLVPLEKANVFNTSRVGANSRNVLNHLSEIFKDTMLEGHKMAAIFIDKEFNVKQAIGAYKTFLRFPEESFNFNLLKLVPGDLAIALGVAVRKAIDKNEKIVMRRVVLHEQETLRHVSIQVKPFLKQKEFQQSFLCIVIEEEIQIEQKASKALVNHSLASLERIEELERDLIETRENLQAIIEEMETSNEELQSSTEEMISTNEELQSTNEELQSLNEELHTVSGEHQLKIKELLELNDDLNNYFNNSDIGQIILDKNLFIRKFSPAAKQMVNLRETDIGRSISDITTNIKDFDFIDTIRTVLKTSDSVQKEIKILEDGYYLMKITPYVRQDKTFDGIVVNFTNISESKRLSSIIESVFLSSQSGITAKKAIRDDQNKIVDFEYLAVNNAAEKFFGVPHNSLIGKRLKETFPSNNSNYITIYADVVETGNDSTFEFYNEKTNRWFNISVVKMLDGIVTTHVDITNEKKTANTIARSYEDLKFTTQQLKESNTQLERSNFDLLQFASVASHDLKEPLRKIQAFGNVLQSKIKNKLTEDETNYFNRMIQASGRMQKLIEDVLSLSKLSDNSIPKESVDLVSLSKAISDDLEIVIKEKDAIIEIGELPVINGVSWQMQQLFQNLISNALKFSDKTKGQPRVVISQKEITEDLADEFKITPDDFVCVAVRDNGIGFEKEYKDKIFGLFQRLHGRNYEGTGIGLAISKKIVENHGGYISADGKLNEGAEFFILLPKNSNNLVHQGNGHHSKTAIDS